MKIYIDVGHGGTDRNGTDRGTHGVLNKQWYWENEINLIIANTCAARLIDYGHAVSISRTDNTNFPNRGIYSVTNNNIMESAANIRNGGYDIMVSIHNNSSTNLRARGHQIIYKSTYGCEEDSKQLANYISKCLEEVNVPKNAIYFSTGDKDYGILRLHNTAGCIIEGMFMSNEDDLKELVTNEKMFDIGEAIADGIQLYAEGLIKKPSESPKPATYEQLISTLAKVSNTIERLNELNKELKDLLSK